MIKKDNMCGGVEDVAREREALQCHPCNWRNKEPGNNAHGEKRQRECREIGSIYPEPGREVLLVPVEDIQSHVGYRYLMILVVPTRKAPRRTQS